MYWLIESIQGEIISEHKDLNHLIAELNAIKQSKSDPYYDDLILAGGSLRIEDDNGNGFIEC